MNASPPSSVSFWTVSTAKVKLAGTDSTVVVNAALPSSSNASGASAAALSPIMTLIAQPASASPPPYSVVIVAPLTVTSTFRLTMSLAFAPTVAGNCGFHDTAVMPSVTA